MYKIERMKNIFIYVCSCFLCIVSVLNTNAQELSNPEKLSMPLYQGSFIGLNLAPSVESFFVPSYFSTEVSIDVSLKQKYFPIVEAGIENRKLLTSDYTYNSSGYFAKFGINYNFLKTSTLVPNNIFYIGARYAITSTTYELATQVTESYWNEQGEVSLMPTKSLATWGEIVLGVRAELFPSVLLGTSVRYGFAPSLSNSLLGYPTFIPNYGLFLPNKWLFTYSITYKLPF